MKKKLNTLHKKADILKELNDILEGKTTYGNPQKCFCLINSIPCTNTECALAKVNNKICDNNQRDIKIVKYLVKEIKATTTVQQFRTVKSASLFIAVLIKMRDH